MIPTLSIVFMGVSALVSIGLPVGIYIALRKRFGLKVVPMLVGAAAFVLFALVLEQMLHMLVLRPDENGAIALKNTPALYVLYGIFAAGIFEETARYLSFLLLKKKYNGIGTGLSYGIGHGGVEAVLLAGLSMISSMVICIMLNSGSAGTLEGLLPAAQLETLRETSPYIFLVSGLERTFAVAIQISLSLLVWFSVDKKKWLLFPAAIALHAAIDIPAALMQAGVLKSIALTESMVGVAAVVSVLIAVYVCKSLKKDEKGAIQ